MRSLTNASFALTRPAADKEDCSAIILRNISDLSGVRGPVFLAIGVFDGVHLGHQAVISTSARNAKAAHGSLVVVTFDPHPERVLRPASAPHLLTALQRKIQLIHNLGADYFLVVHFDKEFAATPPELFIEQLVTNCRPLREICVGREWAFGKGRSGDLDLLQKLGMQSGFQVIGIKPVTMDGEIVSSTTIRKALGEGNFTKASHMLGRRYTSLGRPNGNKIEEAAIAFAQRNSMRGDGVRASRCIREAEHDQMLRAAEREEQGESEQLN